ncbi:MAG TPA: sugar kinase [Christensenellaceae bacterium]|nr:sugar kinase [Christensenellaceae bacterium]
MTKFITFGEIMLRLKSPGFERLMQSPSLEATFGGGEANVAVSLANYGQYVRYVTVLPDNDIGTACIRELRGFGLDVSHVVRSNGRMGIYYLETGACQRASKVIYDRDHSAICLAEPGDINWDSVFEGMDWFHVTGITPAVSKGLADLTLEAVKTAKKKGIHVSCDLNYRKKLWKWGRSTVEIMTELCNYVDTIIANEEDVQMSLGIHADKTGDVESGELDVLQYRELAKLVKDKFPDITRICITLRESLSADQNNWSACMYDGNEFFVSKKYNMLDIVDRVGGGDSFSAGIIYGVNAYANPQEALEFAVAASCLKHSIPGDFNRVSVSEVENLMRGAGSGRVVR